MPSHFKDDFPHQAIAIGVKAGRGQSEHDVARGDRASVNHASAFDHATAEAGQVVVAWGIHIRQDRRFSTQQGAVRVDAACRHAIDDLFQKRRIVLRHGHIVEKEQGLRATAESIVDAHRHQVDAHRVVDAHRHRHLELGSHAVGAAD